MVALWLIARRELRVRFASLAGLGVLVALVAGAVLGGTSGAWRTATSIERFRDGAAASDLAFQSAGPRQAQALVAELRDEEDVERVARRVLVNGFLIDGAISDIAVMSDPDGAYGVEVDRPRVVEGRMPRPASGDEILLNEQAAALTGLGVGDHLRARTWSEADLEILFEGTDFPGFNGPLLDLEVVGVGRTAEGLSNDVRRTSPLGIAGSGFVAEHPGVGAWPPAVVVRAAPGTDLDALVASVVANGASTPEGAGVDALGPTVLTAEDAYLATAQQTVDGLAVGLLAFALLAAAAGGLAIGQALLRHLAAATGGDALAPLGMTSGQCALVQTVPVALVGAAGVVVGGTLATVSSGWLPLGLAARAEVDPGMSIRPVVLAGGGLALLGVLVACTYAVSWRTGQRRGRSDRTERRAGLSSLARHAGAPAGACMGVDLATRRGRGALPVCSALAGLAVCVAGVVGAGVVTASVVELRSDPARWGWNWSSMPDYFGDGDVSALETRLRQDPRVDAVGHLVVDGAVLDGQRVTSYAMQALEGSMGLTLRDGRLPTGPDEVALGAGTLSDLQVEVGDRVEVTGGDSERTREVTVVGTAVLPPTDEVRSDIGAAWTPAGLRRHGFGEPSTSLVLRYPGGEEGRAVERGLAADYGLGFGVFTRPQVPGAIRNLGEQRTVASGLAVLLAVLAAVSLFHALIVSGGRHRRDLAMLQVLGLRRRQVRRVLLVQALVLALLGVAVGVPAGLVVGRAVWRGLVGGLGLAAEPLVPWPSVLLLAPVAAASAAAVAWWPAHRVVCHEPAARLRTE